MTRVTYPPIDCTVAEFTHWLDNYTRFIDPPPRFHPRSSPAGNGRYVLQPLQLPDGDIDDRPLTLHMNCVFVPEGQPAPGDDASASPGITFTIVPFRPGQIQLLVECHHDVAQAYCGTLRKAIGSSWSVSPARTEWTSVGTRIEAAPAERIRRAIFPSRRTPAQDVDDSPTLVDQITVPLPRRDVYRHLCALCHDPRFAILGTARTELQLESLKIWDWQMIKRSDGAPGSSTIGIVQLLPADAGTIIRFVTRQFFRQQPVTEEGKAFFRDFIQLVKTHFDQLAIHTPPPSAIQRTGTKRGKNMETATKVAKARLILEQLERKGKKTQKLACDMAKTTPHTFRTWFHDPDVLQEMEQLRQDPDFEKELEAI